MLIAICHSSTDLLQQTVLANKIFLFSSLMFGIGSLLLTVNKATKVGPLAAIALIERAAMVSIFLRFTEIGVALVFQSLII